MYIYTQWYILEMNWHNILLIFNLFLCMYVCRWRHHRLHPVTDHRHLYFGRRSEAGILRCALATSMQYVCMYVWIVVYGFMFMVAMYDIYVFVCLGNHSDSISKCLYVCMYICTYYVIAYNTSSICMWLLIEREGRRKLSSTR